MQFSNSYITLGERFYKKSQPAVAPSPRLFLWNKSLADQLAIATELQQDEEKLAKVFSGTLLLEGAEPIATAYAGHQFGGFNPQLGDGRAHLLGELIDRTGRRWDVQLKGSGTSAYSRGGDGRCAIGPAVREYIMSEAMLALGVPTTQCLAVVATGEDIYRQDGPTSGAVVTRLASSHIRVGTFQFFAARGDTESLIALANYSIERHFPEIDNEGPEINTGHAVDRYILLLDKVIERQILLIVEWLRVGFIHGVMNTDNTAISGETIDFGPCAMMGVYNPQTVYSSIDKNGRYAFGNQAAIAQWNMARFAECLLEIVDRDDAVIMGRIEALINEFPERFQRSFLSMMANKLGFITAKPSDEEHIVTLLEQLAERNMDYTNSFDRLTKSLSSESEKSQIATELGPYYDRWRARVDEQEAAVETVQNLMREYNPSVIPRNHHMEAVLKACEESGEADAAENFLEVLRSPYRESEKTRAFQSVAKDGDKNYHTFCGT